jgi:membrane associated rhomboid family serine protease
MKPNTPQRSYGQKKNPFSGIRLDPVIIIIIINLAIYVACLINKNWVAYYMGLTPLTFAQKPWTLFAYMFVHIDFWGIFGNSLILFFFGRVIYKMVGGWRFVIVYLCGGIAGGLLYLWLGSWMIVVGAYGAVYALMGAMVVIMPKLQVRFWFILPMPLWVTVLISFLILTLPSFFIETLWQPFVGGLAVGLIAGFIFRRQMRHVIYRY